MDFATASAALAHPSASVPPAATVAARRGSGGALQTATPKPKGNAVAGDISLAGSALKLGVGVAKFFDYVPPGVSAVAPVVGAAIQIGSVAAGNLPDAGKAVVSLDIAAKTAGTIALVSAIGAAAAGFAGVIGLALAPLVGEVVKAVVNLFDDHEVPHAVNEAREVARDAGALGNTIFPLVLASGSYEELFHAFDYATTPNFLHDIGGPIMFVDPATGKGVQLNDKAAFLRMIESGNIHFFWQHGIAAEKVNAINSAIDRVVTNQAELIRRAWAGDKVAVDAIWSARKSWALNHNGGFGFPPEHYMTPDEIVKYHAMLAQQAKDIAAQKVIDERAQNLAGSGGGDSGDGGSAGPGASGDGDY